MPSRREQIGMTPGEVRAYLEEQRRIIVVTNGVNGLPHAVPMNYGLDDQGRILITTFRKSQKVKNLERDPRATVLVESGTVYSQLKSVIAYCDAEIIDDPALVPQLMRLIRAQEAMAASLSKPMREQVRESTPKRVVVRFSAFHTVSWDHAKLGGSY
jgi:nitroimidazol reductase NimA-like FMN-containing flavoprotein (pyridoxamine 5'-phosphate oxidase superfamily)